MTSPKRITEEALQKAKEEKQDALEKAQEEMKAQKEAERREAEASRENEWLQALLEQKKPPPKFHGTFGHFRNCA